MSMYGLWSSCLARARVCLKFVSASLCLGRRGVSCYFLMLYSLACRQQGTCVVYFGLTSKEIVSLVIDCLY